MIILQITVDKLFGLQHGEKRFLHIEFCTCTSVICVYLNCFFLAGIRGSVQSSVSGCSPLWSDWSFGTRRRCWCRRSWKPSEIISLLSLWGHRWVVFLICVCPCIDPEVVPPVTLLLEVFRSHTLNCWHWPQLRTPSSGTFFKDCYVWGKWRLFLQYTPTVYVNSNLIHWSHSLLPFFLLFRRSVMPQCSAKALLYHSNNSFTGKSEIIPLLYKMLPFVAHQLMSLVIVSLRSFQRK